MPRKLTAPALVIVCLAIVGCGGDEERGDTPSACRAKAAGYLEALAGAPGNVTLDGATAISGCIVPNQSSGALQDAGSAMVAAAASLNREARRAPSSDASVELGYLVGAVERGAEDTGGIHADLIRRLNASARFSPDGSLLPAEFERAFGRGYAAGLERG